MITGLNIYVKKLDVPNRNKEIGEILSFEQLLGNFTIYNPHAYEEVEDDIVINYTTGTLVPIVHFEEEVKSEWKMLDYVFNQPPLGWRKLFKIAYNELCEAETSLSQSNEILIPEIQNIFRIFYLCPLRKIKVVILGNDPHPSILNGVYRDQGMAYGLSPTDLDLGQTLKYIFNELISEYPDYQMPTSGNLLPWVEQGVFLLNLSLTTFKDKYNVHRGIWQFFVDKVLTTISQQNKHVVFMLWGNDAVNACDKLSDRAYRIITSYPSYGAANKAFKQGPAFIGSGCFTKANNELIKNGISPIRW